MTYNRTSTEFLRCNPVKAMTKDVMNRRVCTPCGA
jgi:hypothetical protein